MPIPLVARAGVLAEVDSALAAACAGRGELLMITGEPGIGKTRLAEEAARRADGFEVIWTWCPAAAGAAALRPWSRVLRILAGGHAAVARLIADSPFLAALADPARAGGDRDPEGARTQLSLDLSEVIAAAAAQRPVLVVIDDAHQADASSLRLLADLAPALRTMPAVVLVTARDGDQDWHGRLDLRGRAAAARPGYLAAAVWTLAYRGREARMRDSKGLRDLHVLLARPGAAVAALDLATTPASAAQATAAPASTAPGGHRVGASAGPDVLHPPSDTGEVIDAQARAAYRQRLSELEEAAAEADAAADIERSARIAAERDALVEALTSAYGLGGRVRRSGSAAERARTAVTARIRDSIRRIGDVHPELGRHLARSVRTGTFCVYEPDQPVRWSL